MAPDDASPGSDSKLVQIVELRCCARQRAVDSAARWSPEFPGNVISGLLDEDAEDGEEFGSFANDEVCPALDPQSGTCDLYAARPMTCRVFGPPVRSEGGLGVCELCYHCATAEEIASCEMVPDPDDLEFNLIKKVGAADWCAWQDTVVFALAQG
jgi:Fe-S-cluster containining protein